MNLRTLFYAIIIIGLGVTSCGGGGGKRSSPTPQPLLVIEAINTQPSTISVSTVVTLTAIYNNPSLASGRQKVWEVSGGTISDEQPDFGLIIKETAGLKSVSASVSTTADKVYWFTPSTPGEYTVSLTVGGASKQIAASVQASPIVLDINNTSDQNVVITVRASNVSNLYQAAFRITYNVNRYTPISVEPGNFLGSSNEILFLGLTNQQGVVPVGITRKGGAAGVSGSGTLSTITFQPKSQPATSRETSVHSLAGFSISFYLLLDSQGNPIR